MRNNARSKGWSIVIGVSLFVTALGLRLFYLDSVQVPLGGDAAQYVAYAVNLKEHGTFSHARPGPDSPVPDAFRSPGYPLLIVAAFRIGGEDWHRVLLLMQACMGAFSAIMTFALLREWVARWPATVGGILVAGWPHLITINSYLLSETLYGALILTATYLVAKAWGSSRIAWAAGAGLVGAAAYLVNPVGLVAIVGCMALMFAARPWKHVAAFAICFSLAPIGWEIRNAGIDLPAVGLEANRGLINFVQGSWPDYQDAHRALLLGQGVNVTLHEVGEETSLLHTSPMSGLRRIGARFMRDPLRYAFWYAIEKPALLWAWDIRVGQGDIYVYATVNSPFERFFLLRVWRSICVGLNPVLAILALATTVAALIRYWCVRDARVEAGALASIAAVLFLSTAVHVLLQAEPRYAIPYRPLEFVAAVCAMVRIWKWQQAIRLSLSRNGKVDNADSTTAAARLGNRM